jgi:hypothetical protein
MPIDKSPTKEIFLVIDVTIKFKFNDHTEYPNGMIIRLPYHKQAIKEIINETLQHIMSSSGSNGKYLTHITINEIVKGIAKTQFTPYLQGSYEFDVLDATN